MAKLMLVASIIFSNMVAELRPDKNESNIFNLEKKLLLNMDHLWLKRMQKNCLIKTIGAGSAALSDMK